MPTAIHIDFVSDIVCPWCAIGFNSLLKAIEVYQDNIELSFHFAPFELSPNMGSEGELVTPYLREKYHITEEQVKASHAQITQRGAELGFIFAFTPESKKWSTVHAHRLLYWAAQQGDMPSLLRLKNALFKAYFSHNQNISDHRLLAEIACQSGFDQSQAYAVLTDNQYLEDVRNEQKLWLERGIQSVPAMVFNRKYIVSGGQSIDSLVKVIEQLLEESVQEPAE